MPNVRPVFALLLAAAGVRANDNQALLRAAAQSNVNQRYTIESVALSGAPLDRARLPQSLKRRLETLVGSHYDAVAVDELSAILRRDLHLKDVASHVTRGAQPSSIRLNFETVRHPLAFEVSVPRFLYHSSQGWSGELNAGVRMKEKTLNAAIIGNGNDFVERATGYSLRAEDASLASGRVRLSMETQAFHSQWQARTVDALRASGSESELYTSRNTVSPALTFEIAQPLTVAVGASFTRMESLSGLPTRSSNAITADVRYRRKLIDASYSFRAAGSSLGSDYGYQRHLAKAAIRWKSGRTTLSDEVSAGAISGSAPLYEKFVLGGSSTLRGWDRYRIDPSGSDTVVHNSVSAGYRIGDGAVETFYDVGSLREVRHSLGFGYRQKIFSLCVAFPVMDGRIAPIFIAGMNY